MAKTTPTKIEKADAWLNALTGLGTARDKRTAGRVVNAALSPSYCAELYRSDDMAARVVDRPAADMVREWFRVSIRPDATRDREAKQKAAQAAEDLDTKLDELNAQHAFETAIQYQRAQGGGAIFLGVNDGATVDELVKPLDPKRVHSVDFLTPYSARELIVDEWEDNPFAPDFGQPRIYRLNASTFGASNVLANTPVHASRVLRFCGPVAERADLLRNHGWGQSVFQRMATVLRDFGMSWEGAAALLQNLGTGKYSVKGLSQMIAADAGGDLRKRFELLETTKSMFRAMFFDADGEDFKYETLPMAGLAEALDRLCNRLAAAAEMPVSMLMGQAPAGLNATGGENTRYYYDTIAAHQKRTVKPQADRLVKLLFLSRQGPTSGQEPHVWSIKFHPLWQLPETDAATVRANLANADNVYLTHGVVTAEEVAEARFGGDDFGFDLTLDGESRELFGSLPDLGDLPEGDDPGEEGDAPAPTTIDAPAAAEGAPAPTGKLADAALSGGQITSALEIVAKVAAGDLPRESGLAMLEVFFQLSGEAAAKVMGPVGESFKVEKQPPPPAFGGRPPPPPPGAKAEAQPPPAPPAGEAPPDDEK